MVLNTTAQQWTIEGPFAPYNVVVPQRIQPGSGGSSLEITVPATGTYVFLGRCQILGTGTTYLAEPTLTLEWNYNGVTIISDQVTVLPTLANVNYAIKDIPMNPIFVAMNAGDFVDMRGLLSAAPYSGTDLVIAGACMMAYRIL